MRWAAPLDWPERVDLWDRALAAVRAHLRGAGLREVSTPVRVAHVALEPYIEPIGAPPGLLATSPELAMKRLLCRGSGPIFQIAHVFRRAEVGARHSEEFHLIEWYRVEAALAEGRRDVEALVDAVMAVAGREGPRRWETRGILEVVEETFGARLAGDEEAGALAELASGRDLPLVAQGLDDEDPEVRQLAAWTAFLSEWSDRYLDPWLRARAGTGIHLGGFPPALAALAELVDDGAGRLAARFESFVDGIELANGYQELRAPHEQRRRFLAVAGLRRALGLPHLELDRAFLGDLEGRGLPRSAGVALGLDRLLMLAVGASSLADISLALGAPGHPAEHA